MLTGELVIRKKLYPPMTSSVNKRALQQGYLKEHGTTAYARGS